MFDGARMKVRMASVEDAHESPEPGDNRDDRHKENVDLRYRISLEGLICICFSCSLILKFDLVFMITYKTQLSKCCPIFLYYS